MAMKWYILTSMASLLLPAVSIRLLHIIQPLQPRTSASCPPPTQSLPCNSTVPPSVFKQVSCGIKSLVSPLHHLRRFTLTLDSQCSLDLRPRPVRSPNNLQRRHRREPASNHRSPTVHRSSGPLRRRRRLPHRHEQRQRTNHLGRLPRLNVNHHEGAGQEVRARTPEEGEEEGRHRYQDAVWQERAQPG